MRIALVSPYSWTYPGGVTRHIEALSDELIRQGHEARVLAPFDPPDELSARLHRGARPALREAPEHLVSLGRTVGFHSNGAVSNLAVTPQAVSRLKTELARGGYDVVHLHEPVAPVICWHGLASGPLPLVGTYHTYGTAVGPHGMAAFFGSRRRMNRLAVRIAVSEAAAWTARRFYGGHYRIIPNGVDVPDRVAPPAARPAGAPLRIVFVGQAVERKGLPVLVRAFEALREHVPAELTLIGVAPEEVDPLVHSAAGIRALGKVDDAAKQAALRAADVLCAPSLGGESFGMVLTEAFAEGTAVIASDIPGYREVVRHGEDGLLVPPGDPTRLAEVLRDVALDRPLLARLGETAARHARRFAWPVVAGQVLAAYEDAVAMPAPAGVRERAARAAGLVPADGLPRVPARRLPSLEPREPPARRGVAVARRIGFVAVALLMAWLSVVALRRIGLENVGRSLLASDMTWVFIGLALMASSMFLRAVSWHAILRAALPWARVRRRDAFRGTAIGVLMSATLPARLGEPARALVVARRVGRPRESFPAVLGTLVSQTLLNILALLLLGTVMLSSVRLFAGHHGALAAIAVLPLVVLASVVAAPALLRSGLPARSRRVHRRLRQLRGALTSVRSGLTVFRSPRLGLQATVAQLAAWGLQWLSCWALLVALGLDHRAGISAAAAVLFAVNVSAVLPATPSNLGVFQAACVAVLHGAYGVGTADALGYGIVLQAVEIATAIALGTPALLREGLSWKDVRLRTMYAAPVQLAALPARATPAEDGAEA